MIIRTLDIGADKQADYLGLGTEDNPALGYRAIRICLTSRRFLRTQLRALFRAAVYGKYLHHVSYDHFCGRSAGDQEESFKK